MGRLVTRVGIIGLSEGNGHPFSFSAIINGYDAAAFGEAGWPVIQDYLARQPEAAFGFGDVRVTHAWTQDPTVTARLAAACRILHPVAEPAAMLGAVDAVIVARDDWQTHAPLALPFLAQGIPVFVDKPLTLDGDELSAFAPHLEAGRLMSTSGLRYARELDGWRDGSAATGPLRLVVATVLNGLDRYGIHMLDALSGLGLPPVREITRLPGPHEAFWLRLEDGTPVALNCLGAVGKTFHLSVFGEHGHAHADLHDNFTAFRRTLDAFFGMVRTGIPPIDPSQTVATMQLVAAALQLGPGETRELG